MTGMKQYALITGGSQGLGKSFALELASRKINTILVSLPNENLETLNREIVQNYGVDSHFFELDLTVKEELLSFARHINTSFEVFMLINNAGLGGTKKFDVVDIEEIIRIIEVNILALSVLTHNILPNLFNQEKGYVLNISSMAACSPIGYKTVYPASKAFVHSFSLGLNEELKNTNVSVSVVNPGPMATNGEGSARLSRHGFLARMITLHTDDVAKYCITHLLKRSRVIKVNFWSWSLMSNLPVWFKLPLLTNAVKKELSS
jgi:short-subunit dehydrogenase